MRLRTPGGIGRTEQSLPFPPIMYRHRRLLIICGILLTTGCMSPGCTSLDQPLNGSSVPLEARRHNQTRAELSAQPPEPSSSHDTTIRPATGPAGAVDDAGVGPAHDGFFFGISISGGGSRSANFSAACLFQLQKLGLLQRADYISSVSGGSLTAAYYCVANDKEWNPGNLQHKLTHAFADDVLFNTLIPWNFLALAVTDWDRSDLLADSFRRVLFSRNGKPLTFADLRKDRPRLLINATDLQSGRGFVFCNETFDDLNADLSSYPLAHAVAASSAVPVLLHQVTLRDFSTVYKQYRHLIDGGVVDNLGVKSLVETYRAQLKSSDGHAYPRGAVFIVIDARTQYDARLSNRGDTSLLESLQFGAGVTSTVLLNRASSATLAEIILDSSPDNASAATLRRERDALINGGYVKIENVEGRPVYVLHLALSRVNDLSDLPFKGFTESVNGIATYFNISSTESYNLYQAAELLVDKRFPAELKQIRDALKTKDE
jgi:predicted acylesterase/phospholipase RssA